MLKHKSILHWKDWACRDWILNLKSLKPVIEKYGYDDAFMFNSGEHFEELRQATMLEF